MFKMLVQIVDRGKLFLASKTEHREMMRLPCKPLRSKEVVNNTMDASQPSNWLQSCSVEPRMSGNCLKNLIIGGLVTTLRFSI